MRPAIGIDMLGSLRATVGERIISRFTTQHAALLLASMALTPDSTLTREALIEKLWPECDPAVGRNRLSTALSSLRRQMEPPGTVDGTIIQATRFSVGLRPGAVLTDVAGFREAVRAAAIAPDRQAEILALRQAVALYRGPFLDGLFAEWIEPERISFAGRFLHNVRRLVRLCAMQGDYVQALEYALRALALDPLRQELHRDVIQAYALLGDAAAANRHYEDFAILLKRELGDVPSATLRDLNQKLQSGILINRRTENLPGVDEAPRPANTSTSLHTRANIPPLPRLPISISRFFGREMEIASLHGLLRDNYRRLITLTGPAGSGKTRLALEVAEHIAAYSSAVCFVDLTAMSDPDLLPSGIALSLGLTPDAKLDSLDQIERALSGPRWFVVLDNFEHLLAHSEHAATLVQTLLERIPSLTCIVTSRRLLGLAIEHDFPTPPLDVPAPNAESAKMAAMASVALFVDRAQQVLPDFQLTPRNAGAVAGICRHLEGIPLAIELAAARIKAIPLARMLEELNQRFDVLVTRRRSATARHRTLWSAVEWSYVLLPVEVQRFFCRLSVFRGGWTAEAATAVCDEDNAHQYLDLLRDASLVRKEETPLGARFRMLETLREFGWEQMSEEARAEVHRCHVNYFLRLALNTRSEDEGADKAACLLRLKTDNDDQGARPVPGLAFRQVHAAQEKAQVMQDMLETEHENLRHALTFCAQNADAGEAGLQLGSILASFWWMRGYLAEGLKRLTDLLALPGAQGRTKARASALSGAASLVWLKGDVPAATSLFQEVLNIHRELGDRYGQAKALNNLGLMADAGGDYTLATSLCAESLEIFREIGDRHGIGWVLSNLGLTSLKLGDYALAQELQQESLATRRDIGDGVGIGISLDILGTAARIQGDYASARSLLNESLEIRWKWRDLSGVVLTLESLAALNALDSNPEMAARLWAVTGRNREETSFSRPLSDQTEYDRNFAALRQTMSEQAFSIAWAEGWALTMQEAVDMVLATV